VYEVWLLCLLVMAFALGAGNFMELISSGLAWGAAVSAVLVVVEALGAPMALGATPFAGLYGNKNFLAEACGFGLIYALWTRNWFLAALLAPGIAIAESRAVWLGLGAAGCVWFWLNGLRWIAAAIVVGGVSTAAMVFSSETLLQRFDMWGPVFSHLLPFGHGAGAFYVDFPQINVNFDLHRSRPGHPHNEIVLQLYELGVGAVGIVGMMLVALWRARSQHLRCALVYLGVLVCVSFPFHIPTSLLAAGLLLGHGWAEPDGRRHRPSLGGAGVLQRFALWKSALRFTGDGARG